MVVHSFKEVQLSLNNADVNLSIIYSRPSVSLISPYPWIQPSADGVVL